MLQELNASVLTQFHDRMLADLRWPLLETMEEHSDVWRPIAANHRYNTMLWNEEDKARRTDVSASEIAASKRLIDQYNQKRNDAVEAIDESILTTLEHVSVLDNARLHSETAGAMIDRLSILSLKIHHMREQTQRVDAGLEHIQRCTEKLHRLITQRKDLGACFDALMTDVEKGRAYFKVYRQFKMYNDPMLNPYLYGQREQTVGGGVAT